MIKSVLVYLITFIISICFSLLYQKIKKNGMRKIIMLLAIAAPIFISTFRYGVGTDYFHYQESYNYIIKNISSFNDILSYYQEPMHVVLNLISYKLFNDYRGFCFLSSLVFMFVSFHAIKTHEDKLSLSLSYFIFLLTIYSLSFNGIRQMIAVSIIFYSYKYIYNRELKKYLLCVLLAFLFHKSAIFCLLLYFVWFDQGKHKRLFYLYAFLLLLLISPIIVFIQRITSIFNVYESYISLGSSRATLGFLLYILPILVVFIFKKKGEDNKLVSFLFRLYILQIPLQIIGNYIAYADRLAIYLLTSQVLLFPIYLETLRNNKKLVRIIIISWYIVYYIVMFIVLNSNGVYPFNFMF